MRKNARLWTTTIGLFLVLLYLTIYLHELAHAVSAYSSGCKDNWWGTAVTPFLYKSTGGSIDYQCVANIGAPAYLSIGISGIAINLVLALLCTALTYYLLRKNYPVIIGITLSVFAVTNFIEAFSYLSINGVFPRSDMLFIFEAIDVNNVVVGLVFTVLGVIFTPLVFRPLVNGLNQLFETRQAIWPVLVMSASIMAVMILGRMG